MGKTSLNNNNNNQLCLTRVAHNSLKTDKPVALEFPIELEFRNVGFCGGRKTALYLCLGLYATRQCGCLLSKQTPFVV